MLSHGLYVYNDTDVGDNGCNCVYLARILIVVIYMYELVGKKVDT